MSGVVIARPGLYVLSVQAGGLLFEGTKMTVLPEFQGATDGSGAAALLIDTILLAAGIVPVGLIMGVPQ